MEKKKERAKILANEQLAPDIYDMRLETTFAGNVKAGQFIGLYPKDKSTLLPRPISICEADKEKGELRIVYRKAGKGTEEFSVYRPGETAELLGMLGNGFPMEEGRGRKVVLLGGGIGIPPLLELAKGLAKEATSVTAILGYRDDKLFLKEDMEKYAKVLVSTEDGSVYYKGNVLDVMRAEAVQADILMACGPMPMLRAVKSYAGETGCKAYISLEERMACGVGACLGCVCKTKEINSHSHVKNARICTDGPVFDAEEVDI